ncbi:MAG: hypothetical protein EOO41_03735, partial [Methanobacteriota archaeon]
MAKGCGASSDVHACSVAPHALPPRLPSPWTERDLATSSLYIAQPACVASHVRQPAGSGSLGGEVVMGLSPVARSPAHSTASDNARSLFVQRALERGAAAARGQQVAWRSSGSYQSSSMSEEEGDAQLARSVVADGSRPTSGRAPSNVAARTPPVTASVMAHSSVATAGVSSNTIASSATAGTAPALSSVSPSAAPAMASGLQHFFGASVPNGDASARSEADRRADDDESEESEMDDPRIVKHVSAQPAASPGLLRAAAAHAAMDSYGDRSAHDAHAAVPAPAVPSRHSGRTTAALTDDGAVGEQRGDTSQPSPAPPRKHDAANVDGSGLDLTARRALLRIGCANGSYLLCDVVATVTDRGLVCVYRVAPSAPPAATVLCRPADQQSVVQVDTGTANEEGGGPRLSMRERTLSDCMHHVPPSLSQLIDDVERLACAAARAAPGGARDATNARLAAEFVRLRAMLRQVSLASNHTASTAV